MCANCAHYLVIVNDLLLGFPLIWVRQSSFGFRSCTLSCRLPPPPLTVTFITPIMYVFPTTGRSRGGLQGCNPPLIFRKIVVIRVVVVTCLGRPRRERPPDVYGHVINVPTHFNFKLPPISADTCLTRTRPIIYWL